MRKLKLSKEGHPQGRAAWGQLASRGTYQGANLLAGQFSWGAGNLWMPTEHQSKRDVSHSIHEQFKGRNLAMLGLVSNHTPLCAGFSIATDLTPDSPASSASQHPAQNIVRMRRPPSRQSWA